MPNYKRNDNDSDHDILIRIDENLKNHVNDFNEHKKDFKQHTEEDCKVFGDFETRFKVFDNLVVRTTTVCSLLFVFFVGLPKIIDFIQFIHHFFKP